jgi:RNA polymerase sigma-54 factor
MKQSLQIKLGQQLTMTPQLQQAIRLLQLSTLELSLEVQQVLDSNIMLEMEDGTELGDTGLDLVSSSAEGASEGAGEESDWESTAEGEPEELTATTTDDIPVDMPVDADWDEVFDDTLRAPGQGLADDDTRDNQAGASESLHEHLTWQLNLLPLSAIDREIGLAIIDAIDDDGFLRATLEELHALLDDPSRPEPVLIEEVAAVLKQVQAMEPAGVGARDVRECLLIQLRQLPDETPFRDCAERICETGLEQIANRDFSALARRLRLPVEDIREGLRLMRTLSPRPGSGYATTTTEYLVPDVYVRKINGRWKVELNTDTVPQLRINPYYASMIRRADNSADNNALRTHLQEARWFMKSLQSRSETLLRVARAIVERQRAFLEHGEEAMRPLVLHDIAETLEMHESTISRVTTRKYMHTPRGTFELKYFFSSHVGTALGGEASSTAIRAVIKRLIAAESAVKPLSDSKIASILVKEGINVARRTVAKYREGMQIPPSNERKRYA